MDLRNPELEKEPKQLGFSDPEGTTSPLTRLTSVAWGEMDSLDHVNNIYHLRWIENVRFHYFTLVGLDGTFKEAKVGPILGSSTMCYTRPVRFPDTVEVSTRVISMSKKSFVMENRLWSRTDDVLLGYGQSTIVTVDYSKEGSPVSVPIAIKAAIEALESTHPKGCTWL